MRGKTFQIMGFYIILYNISNFTFGPNVPFKIEQLIATEGSIEISVASSYHLSLISFDSDSSNLRLMCKVLEIAFRMAQ